MNERTRQKSEINETQASILENIKESEMELEVIIADMKITIEELYNLVPGKTLKFKTSVEKPVSLAVNNKKFADGVIVRSGDYYGCEILNIL